MHRRMYGLQEREVIETKMPQAISTGIGAISTINWLQTRLLFSAFSSKGPAVFYQISDLSFYCSCEFFPYSLSPEISGKYLQKF